MRSTVGNSLRSWRPLLVCLLQHRSSMSALLVLQLVFLWVILLRRFTLSMMLTSSLHRLQVPMHVLVEPTACVLMATSVLLVIPATRKQPYSSNVRSAMVWLHQTIPQRLWRYWRTSVKVLTTSLRLTLTMCLLLSKRSKFSALPLNKAATKWSWMTQHSLRMYLQRTRHSPRMQSVIWLFHWLHWNILRATLSAMLRMDKLLVSEQDSRAASTALA